ncbi:MAG: PEGA domain-containing protein [Myxococcales bacterium]
MEFTVRGARGCRKILGLGLGAVLLGMCLFPRRAAAATEDVSRQADALIHRGVELRHAGDDDGASRQFRKAYDLARTPRAAAQLGLAEQALGRWEDAEAHVSEGLLTPNDPWIVKHADVLRDALMNIKEHVGRIEVVGDPEGAEVFVNGKLVGKAPLGDPIHVRAGDVHVELRAPGYVRSARSVNVRGGQYQSIVIRLEKEQAAPGAAAAGIGTSVGAGAASTSSVPGIPSVGGGLGNVTTASPTHELATTPSDGATGGARFTFHGVAKWTAVGLSAGALALGVTATFLRYNKRSQFDNKVPPCRDLDGRAVYADDDPVAAPECQGVLNQFYTARTWQIVGFVGVGVFGVTALVLALTQPEAPATANTANAALSRRPALFDWVCTPSLATSGLACQARF